MSGYTGLRIFLLFRGMCERFVLGMCARCAGMCAACAPHVLMFLSSTRNDPVTCAHVRPCAGVCALSLLTIHVVPVRFSPLNAICDCAHMCVACAGKLVQSLLYGQRDIWRCSRGPHRSCLLRLCPHMPAHGAAHARTWHRSWPRGHTGPRAAAHARTAPHSRPHMPPCPRPARPHMAAHPIADGRTCPHMAPFVAARPHRAARGRTCPHMPPCPRPARPHSRTSHSGRPRMPAHGIIHGREWYPCLGPLGMALRRVQRARDRPGAAGCRLRHLRRRRGCRARGGHPGPRNAAAWPAACLLRCHRQVQRTGRRRRAASRRWPRRLRERLRGGGQASPVPGEAGALADGAPGTGDRWPARPGGSPAPAQPSPGPGGGAGSR